MFKIGDRVEWCEGGRFREFENSDDRNVHDFGTVVEFHSSLGVGVKFDYPAETCYPGEHTIRLVKQSETYPYAELKAAYDAGKTIQFYNRFENTWENLISKPRFNYSIENYRIKPEEEPSPTNEPPQDTVVEELCQTLKTRSEVGIKKYGVTLDRTDLTPVEWCEHAEQEILDLLLYLKRLKRDLVKIESLFKPLDKS